MKKNIIYILITFLVLTCISFLYYVQLYNKLESEDKYKEKTVEIDKGNNISNIVSKSFEENNSNKVKPPKRENLKLYARSAALIDANNGRVLYEKQGNDEMPMASTTKIMTCIIALENGNLDDIVTVSKYASKMPDVQLNIREGEQYRLKDLLYSLMLESHNDVAVAIAEHIGGSVQGFADLMNAKAKELGCEHTNFVTPNGLDAEKHFTTSVELARIAGYAIKNKQFLDITNTSSWKFSDIKSTRNFNVTNKDRFLYLYDGAIGIKTGFTSKAGYCFVGAVDKNNKTFISVVLGSGWPPNKNYKWHDTTKLMDYGMNHYKLKHIFDSSKVFNPVYVKEGQEKYVDLFYEGDVSLLMCDNDVVKVVYKIPKILRAPVIFESVVGTASYYVNDFLVKEIPILASANIKKIDFPFCFDKIKKNWLIY